jgi:hypothetical protein
MSADLTSKAVECTATVSAVDLRGCHVDLVDVRWVTSPQRRDDAREVRVMSVYSPVVGDRVRVLNHGNDFLVLGLADDA